MDAKTPTGPVVAPEDDPRLVTVTGTFQCQSQLSQARSLVITGHIYSNDTPAQISQRIDVAQDEMDRQFTRTDILNKEMQRKATLDGITQVRDQLAALKDRQDVKGEGKEGATRQKLSSQEKLHLQNGDQQIKAMLKQIERLDKEILEGKQRLGIA